MSYLKFLIFPLITLAVLFGSHAFIYYSLVHFYPAMHPQIKNYLLILFIFLSLSFIISLTAVSFFSNMVFDAFYLAAVIWLGLLLNLFIAFALAWIIAFLVKPLGADPKAILATLALVAAFLFTAYGVYLARDPEVRRMDVKIHDLPVAWGGKTVVQLSDAHLGKVHGVDFAEKLVEKINALDPYVIFITGDLFDGMRSDPEIFVDAINKLKAEKGIYFVTGNHEVYLGKERVLKVLEKTRLNILEDKLAIIDGVQIIGIGYPEYGSTVSDSEIIGKMEGFDAGKPSILLHHLPASIGRSTKSRASQQSDTYWTPDIDFTAAKEKGINLQLSGHTHRGQIFPMGYLTEYIYHGFDYGLHADGEFNIYITSGAGTWGPPLRTPKRGEIVVFNLHD